MYRHIRRGIATREIRPGFDVAFVNEMLVGPILARMGDGATADLDPGRPVGGSPLSSSMASELPARAMHAVLRGW